jgi:hypothetical protein
MDDILFGQIRAVIFPRTILAKFRSIWPKFNPWQDFCALNLSKSGPFGKTLAKLGVSSAKNGGRVQNVRIRLFSTQKEEYLYLVKF